MNKRENLQPATKKVYAAPKLKEWGTVADLTRTGNTFAKGDAKTGKLGLAGSVTWSQGN